MRPILLAAAMLLPLAAAPVACADPRTSSDVDPSSTIHAEIHFDDNGSTLTVTGRGFGFDPNLQFVSLLYANPNGTAAQQPQTPGNVIRGALACLPPSPNPYSPAQMFVAYWQPIYPGSRERTLNAQKTGSAYVSLSSIASVSVRYDSTPQVGSPAATTQTPGRYFLQSCGRV